ncbi:MAG: hypothetical protein WDO19_22910 [Bacteroidota bacterium]
MVSTDVSDNNRANQGGVILSALTSTPTSSTQPNPDGSYPYGNPTQALDNPIALTKGLDNKIYTSRAITNVFGELQLPYNLKLRVIHWRGFSTVQKMNISLIP